MIHINKSGHRGKYNNSKVGKYTPIHPEKYKGREQPIFKSNLERLFMLYCDRNPSIIQWSYEGLHIKYLDKSEKPERIKNYHIDFQIWVQGEKTIRKIWVEIKPQSEVDKPKNPNDVRAMKLWLKNQSKWSQAVITARQCGADFRVITENQLK